MFGFKKKQPTAIFAPVAGEVYELKDVPDPVFAGGTMGEGFAVIPTNGEVTSPVSGELFMLFPTAHAFAVRTPSGAEVLVHVGVDTVSLQGTGFEALRSQGDTVRAGDPVVRYDLGIAEDPRVISADVLVVVTKSNGLTLSQLRTGTADPQDGTAVLTLNEQ